MSIYGPPNGTKAQKSRHCAYVRNVAKEYIDWTEYQRRINDPNKRRNRPGQDPITPESIARNVAITQARFREKGLLK